LHYGLRPIGIVHVAGHQASGSWTEFHRDFAFLTLFVLQIDYGELKSRKRTAHAA
jgi:hypothetical protein